MEAVMLEMLGQAGILALLSLVIAVVPLLMGIVYAVRPTEARLALMRPLSLASLFAGLGGFTTGVVNMLKYSAFAMPSPTDVKWGGVMVGTAEALVPLLLAFGCLTVGWLCVALGMTRQA